MTGEVFPKVNDISGGLGSNYYYLSKNLAHYGFKTILICAGAQKYPKIEKVNDTFEIHRINANYRRLDDLSFWLPMNIKAISKIKNLDYDLVQLHNFFFYWVQKTLKKPNVLTVHGCDWEIANTVEPFPGNISLYRNIRERTDIRKILFLSKRMCQKATHVVSVCEAVKQELIENLKIQKITAIPNGVDPKVFKKEPRKPLSEKYDTDFTLLYVGTFQPRKGIKYLVNALKDLKHVKLIIIGNDLPVYRRYLNYLIRQANISEKVIFIGKVPNNKLKEYYSATDVLILPTISEGLPKVIIEALACECPVIATNTSGNPEIIHHMKTGLLVPTKDPDAIKDAILWTMNNRKKIKQMAHNGRQLVLKEYTWKKSAKKYASLYNSLI